MHVQLKLRTRRAAGDLLEVDVRRQGLAARVDLQDGDTALNVRAVHRDLQNGRMCLLHRLSFRVSVALGTEACMQTQAQHLSIAGTWNRVVRAPDIQLTFSCGPGNE